MDLIKTLDDERLGHVDIFHISREGVRMAINRIELYRDSLRAVIVERDAALEEETECVRHIAQIAAERDAALEERDSWKRDSESLRKEIQRWYDKLQASDAERDAALSQQLAARDALIEIVNNCGCADDTDFCMNCVRANEAIAALSSSSPCVHVAEVSQYKAELEAVYKALNTKIVNDDRIKQLEEAVEWACENAPAGENAYVAGIRRRAGKEGG